MKDFPTIYANEGTRRRLADAVRAGTLAHAYIIEGAEGSGKCTLATQLAAAHACRGGGALPCGTCPSCHRILTRQAPDVRYLTPSGATIGVDAIREMRSDMYLSSSENERKVYIIEKAHLMTPQAQNALLIVMEEPPTEMMLLLLTDRADALLPTIRSRAQHIRMELLRREQMEQALLENKPLQLMKQSKPEEYEALLEMAGGCLGRILEAADGKSNASLMKDRALVGQTVDALCRQADYAAAVRLLSDYPTKRQEVVAVLNLLHNALRDLVLLSRDKSAPLTFFLKRQQAQELCGRTSLAKLLAALDRVGEALDALDRNANVNLTLQALFHQIF